MMIKAGYIEGYYGKLLRWDERIALVRHMRRLGLNTYVYAPKEDPYHRQDWRTTYPGEWLNKFSSLVSEAKKSKISVVPALAPGLSYDYLSQKDYRILLKKMKALCKTGITELALLMDDIHATLPKSCQKAFTSLGEAHGKLLQVLHRDLMRTYPRLSLWFCPTIYTDRFSEGDASNSEYLEDLAQYMPSDIQIFWTGIDVIAPAITSASIKYITGLFKGKVLIWDNYYANDYCPGRIFLGPLRGRKRDVLKKVTGFFINPTGLLHTDIFYLQLLAGYLKGENPQAAWNKAARKSQLPREFSVVRSLLDSPFDELKSQDMKKEKLEKQIKALHYLIFTWKSDLQREWYPYIYNLKSDLELYVLASKKEAGTGLKRKFSAVMQRLFERAGF